MTSDFKPLTAALALTLAAACGVPLRVTRLGVAGEPAPAQTGMRFRLARPAFHLELAMEEKGQHTLVVRQSLDAAPLVFQADTAPSWLADTDVTIAVDANEMLTSASAGENDRTKDAVEAALAVASAAALTATGAPGCAGGEELNRALADFEKKQNARIESRDAARKSLDQCLASMLNCAARNAELARRQQELEQSRLDLDDYASLSLATSDPNAPHVLLAHPSPCFRVELKESL